MHLHTLFTATPCRACETPAQPFTFAFAQPRHLVGVCLMVLVLFELGVIAQGQDQQPSAKPGAAIEARAAADATKLLPQRGLGGDDTARVTPNATTFSECTIDVPGCDKMKGFISTPADLESGKKYALMFMFHGNGDPGAGRVRNVSAITTKRDPIFVIGVQYQELLPNGGGKMGLPQLADNLTILKGARWLLDKVMKEHPIDPHRVFVGGFSWGTAWTSQWCNKEWADDRDKFPFRAAFLFSSGGMGTKTTIPPIPIINIVGADETTEKGNYNVLPGVRHYSNTLASWGVPVQHHEIPGMGHQVNGRCLQICRDIINELGGPGALPYGTANAPKSDPLPFPASDDPYVKELMALCAEDQWARALARIKEIEKDRSIKSKDKKAASAFEAVIDAFAKKEIPRLDKLIAQNIKDEVFPNPMHLRRQRALLAVYAKQYWVDGKGYDLTLAKLDDTFPPVVREKERAAQMSQAWKLESEPGKRGEAKALYEKLAARNAEDGGTSVWPKAAAYRLQWWVG